MEICIYSSDKNLIHKLESFLNQFLREKNINFRISKINSYDELNINKFIDILFIELNDNIPFKILESIPTIYISDVLFYTLNDISQKNTILKPINYKSFCNVFSIFFSEFLENNKRNKSLILEKINEFSIDNNFKFDGKYKESKNNIKNINSSCILYIENLNKNKVKIFTEKNSFEIDESIDLFEKNLKNNFFRCNKDFLINIKKLSKIGRDFVIINDYKIKVDKNKFKILKNSIIDILKINF